MSDFVNDRVHKVALGATIAYTPRKRDVMYIEMPDTDIVSGIYTSGNANNKSKIILSEEFWEYFDRAVDQLDAEFADVKAKLEAARKEFMTQGGQGFVLSLKYERQIAGGKFNILYSPKFIRKSVVKRFCGVCFYPRGMLEDIPEPQGVAEVEIISGEAKHKRETFAQEVKERRPEAVL